MQDSCLLFLSALSLSFLLLILTLQWIRRLTTPRGLLPPGSMGWPYIGDTLKLYTQDPNSFFSQKKKRYGNIFKTNILGCPCVMVSSPEAAKVVLVTQAHLFKPTYPPSKEKLIGPHAVFFHQGEYHRKLKKLLQASFLPSAIKGSVPEIDQIAKRLIPSWEHRTINTLHEMKRYAFDVAMLSIFGPDELAEKDDIKKLYGCLEKGYNCMPLDLPGTSYRKALEARQALNEILRKMIEKRREGKTNAGLFDALLENEDGSHFHLDDTQVADNVIGILFAAHDTTASVLTWIMKFLSEDRVLLETVTLEQEKVQTAAAKAGGLTWEHTRHMPVTSLVIQETLRIASILSFTFREAVEDVELEGYLVPKGWKVLPLFRSIHHSKDYYHCPDKFDPSRFKLPIKPNTYMPFGSGIHSCPGNELAKLEMLVLLHHLTTQYRWSRVDTDDGVQYRPFPVPKHGLLLEVVRRNGTQSDSGSQLKRDVGLNRSGGPEKKEINW